MDDSGLYQLTNIRESLPAVLPELLLAGVLLLQIILGLLKATRVVSLLLTVLALLISLLWIASAGMRTHVVVFDGMLTVDGLSGYLRILLDAGGIFACVLSARDNRRLYPEYFTLIIAIVLGGSLLVMSNNFVLMFLSLELISLASYVLAGFSFDKKSSEGSIKYFLFGAAASAVMLYGFSLLYGLTGTVDLYDRLFFEGLLAADSPMILISCLMVLMGFLYKIGAAPMHPWLPDVYEAAPIPVIALFSVVPKLAGLGILIKFVLAIHAFGQSLIDWQAIVAGVAFLSLAVGNFSALLQSNAKRMMAYSTIAQTGFLLVGIAVFLPTGIHFMLFYASIYLLMNFLVFDCLNAFEREGISEIEDFSGLGKRYPARLLFLLVGLVSLTGLPPTAGFTAKLFIFSGLWESYHLSHKSILAWLFIFGLLNTAVSLFYYLKIPWVAFLRSDYAHGAHPAPEPARGIHPGVMENLFGLIMVLLLLGLFFMPGLLMGWINKINFVQ